MVKGVEGWQMTNTPTNTSRHSITCMKGFVWGRGWDKLSYPIEIGWFSNWSLWRRLPAFSEAGSRGLDSKALGQAGESVLPAHSSDEPAISGHTLSNDSASLLQREVKGLWCACDTHSSHKFKLSSTFKRHKKILWWVFYSTSKQNMAVPYPVRKITCLWLAISLVELEDCFQKNTLLAR